MAPATAALLAIAVASPADPIFALIAEHRRVLAEGMASSDRGHAFWKAYGLPQRQRCLDDPEHQRWSDLADKLFGRCCDLHHEMIGDARHEP